MWLSWSFVSDLLDLDPIILPPSALKVRVSELMQNLNLNSELKIRFTNHVEKLSNDNCSLSEKAAAFSELLAIRCYIFGQTFADELGILRATPYVHTVVCHSVMLMGFTKGLGYFSQQGFEAHHKWQKRVFDRASSKDGKPKFGKQRSSIEQILEKFYRLKVLKLRESAKLTQPQVKIAGETEILLADLLSFGNKRKR
jgi:hypothetical protein